MLHSIHHWHKLFKISFEKAWLNWVTAFFHYHSTQYLRLCRSVSGTCTWSPGRGPLRCPSPLGTCFPSDHEVWWGICFHCRSTWHCPHSQWRLQHHQRLSSNCTSWKVLPFKRVENDLWIFLKYQCKNNEENWNECL